MACLGCEKSYREVVVLLTMSYLKKLQAVGSNEIRDHPPEAKTERLEVCHPSCNPLDFLEQHYPVSISQHNSCLIWLYFSEYVVAANLWHNFLKSGLKGFYAQTLPGAFLHIAQGLKEPRLRADYRQRLLVLCSDVSLVAESRNGRFVLVSTFTKY